jgi:hypothetical protein
MRLVFDMFSGVQPHNIFFFLTSVLLPKTTEDSKVENAEMISVTTGQR